MTARRTPDRIAAGTATVLLGLAGLTLALPSASAAPKGDPPGNNGTVKIAGLGDIDTIPNNQPHPGCSFTVQWYGFDQGADIVSQVNFALQAPTSGAGYSLATTGDTSVFVGADPAGGAGNDPDGEETYTLKFTGAPHPKQGYHVKLTVHTPRSHGNDSKTKVFWVEDCVTATPTPEPVVPTPPVVEPTPPVVEPTPPVVEPTPPVVEPTPPAEVRPSTPVKVTPPTSTQPTVPQVKGTSAVASPPSRVHVVRATAAAVPTEVDAGLGGAARTESDGSSALVTAGLISGGLLGMAGLAGVAALVSRRRGRYQG